MKPLGCKPPLGSGLPGKTRVMSQVGTGNHQGIAFPITKFLARWHRLCFVPFCLQSISVSVERGLGTIHLDVQAPRGPEKCQNRVTPRTWTVWSRTSSTTAARGMNLSTTGPISEIGLIYGGLRERHKKWVRASKATVFECRRPGQTGEAVWVLPVANYILFSGPIREALRLA